MLVLPLKGDKIQTKEGVTFTVLSFTNYRDKGPAVYVEHTPGVPSDAVYFFDIITIAGKNVEYVTGSKVFKAAGEIARKFQLPQSNDTITIRGQDGSIDIIVTGLKLHKRGELAKGLFVVGHEVDSEDKMFIRLDKIVDLKRDIGNDMFNRDRFLSYYDDYRGAY
jgi:hypothetical protein